MERLDSSVRRLLELKRRVGLFAHREVNLDSIPTIVGRRAHQEVADDVAARALTLVQRGAIDAFRETRSRVAVIAYAEETNLSIGHELTRTLRARGEAVSYFRLFPTSGPASYDSAQTVIDRMPRVIFASSVRPIAGRGHLALPDALAEMVVRVQRPKSTLLVSFGSPYLLRQLPDFEGAFLLAWHDVSAAERAVADAVAGGAPIGGRLPITLSERYRRGYGIRVPAR
jgi:beta-N-acetylhexosaminidase